MPKIKIKVTINNDMENTSYTVPAIIQDECINYMENKETKVHYNYRENTLCRENKEFQMNYRFNRENKTTGNILMKDINKEIELEIKTNKLERKNHNIEIHFSVEGKEFLYKIEEVK